MKIPFPRSLLARSAQGAIVEPGDGEIDVPATVVPIGTVGTPIDTSAVVDSANIMTMSHFGSANALQLGPTGAAVNSPRLGRGLWHIRGQWSVSWSGTVGDGQVTLFLTDVNGVTAAIVISRNWLIRTPFDFTFPLDLSLMVEGKATEGVRFTTSVPGGAVGDKLGQSLNYIANKIW